MAALSAFRPHALALALCAAPAACSSQGSGPSGQLLAEPPGDGGLRPFVPPDPTRLGAGQMLLTASGESLAEQGYAFPDVPSNGVFADGWAVKFTHFIAIFDEVTLSENPDEIPTDQSQTGAPVAEAVGPWIIDLARPTAADVMGKEQGETATPFAVITSQNLNGDRPFATDGTKYAVGFSAVAASPSLSPIDVNLDDEGRQIYGEMLAKGCSVVYDGTAVFEADPTQCTTKGPEFSLVPPVVHFHLCFQSPTTYVNCDNQDIVGISFGDEPHPRGVAFPGNAYVTGEITFHTDHPFWESVIHDTPPHFDQFAARAVGQASDGGPVPTVTLEDMSGVDYLAFTDALGNPVFWRSCVRDSQGMSYGDASGRMMFDPQSVPKVPPGPARTSAGLRDYSDYATYNQSTQGHWNGTDGLCFVRRNYPSPL